MRELRIVLSIFTMVCLVGLVQFWGCVEDDDDDSEPTATPVEETPTPTPTFTPTVSETPEAEMGILNIWTTPVSGDIYVNGEWRGCGVWQGTLPVGVYSVSYGDVAGCGTPNEVQAAVQVNETTHVEGIYVTVFIKTFGGNAEDIGYSVRQTSDGGYIVAGKTESRGAGDSDVYLIRTDAFGTPIWTRTFGGPLDEVGYSVQQTNDGGFIIAGYTYSFGNGDADAYLIKTDGNGHTIWVKMYGGSEWDEARSVDQTSDGGYIIAGSTESFGVDYSAIYIIKTDGNGTKLWSRTYDDLGGSKGTSVQQTSDGGYVIAANAGAIYLIKTDSSGNTLWSRLLHDNAAEIDSGTVQQTSEGDYIVCGYIHYSPYYEYYYSLLIKTDDQGNKLWTRYYERPNYGCSAQQTFDGGYILVGSGNYLLKTETLGNEMWYKKFGGGMSYSVQQASDGGYVMTGYQFTAATEYNYDLLLVKTDPDGNIW